MIRPTHTFAHIPVSRGTYNEIAKYFMELGKDYDHVFIGDGDMINMHGYALVLNAADKAGEPVTSELIVDGKIDAGAIKTDVPDTPGIPSHKPNIKGEKIIHHREVLNPIPYEIADQIPGYALRYLLQALFSPSFPDELTDHNEQDYVATGPIDFEFNKNNGELTVAMTRDYKEKERKPLETSEDTAKAFGHALREDNRVLVGARTSHTFPDAAYVIWYGPSAVPIGVEVAVESNTAPYGAHFAVTVPKFLPPRVSV